MDFQDCAWDPCKATEIMPTAAYMPAAKAMAAAARGPCSSKLVYKLVDQRFADCDMRSNIEKLMRIAEALPPSSALRDAVAWPCEMLVCSGEWRGYAVPDVPFARSLESLCADAGVSAWMRAHLALEMSEMAVALHVAGVAMGAFDAGAFAFDAKGRRLVLRDPGTLRVLSRGEKIAGRNVAHGASALVNDDVRLARVLHCMLSGAGFSDASSLAGLFAASFSGSVLDIPSSAEYAAALQTIVARGFARCECGAEFSRAAHGNACPSCGRRQRERIAARLRASTFDAIQAMEVRVLLVAEKMHATVKGWHTK